MDNNGEPIESGGGGGEIPEDININSVCANSGTFQNLGVGPCGAPTYEFTDKGGNDFNNTALINTGRPIELVGNDVIFTIAYSIGTTVYTPNISLREDSYSLARLFSKLENDINSNISGNGGTSTVTLGISPLGRVTFIYSVGNITLFTLATVNGWAILGNTNASSFPPNILQQFGAPPTFSSDTQLTEWYLHNFDTTGRIYDGDMTITGALSVNTLISDIEVEDAIITLNKNGIADTNTSGVVLNGNSNSTFSGLLKNSSSDDFYLFANSATLPTETGWTPEQTGNLYLNGLSSNSVSVGALGTEYILPSARAAAEGYGLIAGSGNATEWTPRLVLNSLKGELQSPDGQSNFFVSDVTSAIRNAGANRLTITPTQSILQSPDQNTICEVRDDGADFKVGTNKRVEVNSTTTWLRAPNTGIRIECGNNGIIFNVGPRRIQLSQSDFILFDPTQRPVFEITNSRAEMRNGVEQGNKFFVSETQTKLTFNSIDRVLADATVSRVYSPNGQSSLGVEDGVISGTVSTVERMKLDATETVLFSPDTLTSITAQNTEATITKDAQNRLVVDGNTTNIYSPDGQTLMGVANLQASTIFAGTTRQRINATDSRIVSPNQQNTLIISDTETKLQVGLNDRIEANAGAVRIGGAYNIPIVAGTEGQILQVDASGNLAYNSGQVYASLQTGITTAMSLPLQNTYYPFNNGVVGSNSGEFTFGALGLITYTGTYPLFVKVAGHAAVERTSIGTPQIFRFTVLKNGTFNPNSGQCRSRFDDANQWPLEVSFESVIAITTGDTLQLAISNEDAVGSTADVYSYSFVVSKV